ncbi:entericidin B membrane lipoprotein [Oligella ureolytica]|uniref:Entericidin B membrane lipoprotein n=2 Tax=Oligella ureolytica TaxID=90244 RepID=A0A378XDV8_9BURK|nr:entericidin B membrane lipoprotein [Oligella ureolytica]SUA58737.1 entericidin B membrane lipoprotein [Oligella ureolytica]
MIALKGATMKLNRLSRIFLLVCCLAGIAFVSGCNTVQGAGQDIQAGGEAIEEAAQ